MDQWGRPTFQDGAQIYTGLKMIERDNLERQDRKEKDIIEQGVYRLEKGEDISDLPPHLQNKVSERAWERTVEKNHAKTSELKLSEAGMAEERAKIELATARNNQAFKDLLLFADLGDENMAREKAMEIANNSYNGWHFEKTPDGKVEKTQLLTGKKEVMPDMTLPEIIDVVSTYVGKSPEEQIEISLRGAGVRLRHNYNIIKQAETWYSSGRNPIKYIPPGTIDPVSGKPLPGFFTDITGSRKISEAEVQRLGYRPIEEVKEGLGLQLAQARINQANREGTGGRGESLDLFSKERIKSVSKTISEIDKMLLKGTTTDELGDERPLTGQEKFTLQIQRRQFENQAREMQGQNPGELFTSREEVGHAINYGLISKEEGKKYIEENFPPKSTDGSGAGGSSGLNSGEYGPNRKLSFGDSVDDSEINIEPDDGEKTEKPKGLDLRNPINKILGDKPLYEIIPEDYTDVRIDKSGIVWGKSKNGATIRIARKPPETVRDNTGKKQPNPEYQQYVELLQRFGLK